MRLEKEQALNFLMLGYSDAEICKALDIEPPLLREWKKTVEWDAAVTEWKDLQRKHANVKLLSNVDFVLDNASRLIRSKDTPANVKADLIKYLGNKIWGDSSLVDLSKVKAEVIKTGKGQADVNHVSDALEDLKKKFSGEDE